MSAIWMAGVLAAQMLRGVAVLTILGLSPPWAWIIMLGSCLTVSRLRLEVVSAVFTVLLLCSGTVQQARVLSTRWCRPMSSTSPASVQCYVIVILTGCSLSGTQATRSVAAGFATATAAQVLARVTELPWDPLLVSLATGTASAALALAARRRALDIHALDALAVNAGGQRRFTPLDEEMPSPSA